MLNQTQLSNLSIHKEWVHINKCDMTQEEWEAKGGPCMWSIVEQDGDLTLAYDSSYGKMALFKGDKLLGFGRGIIFTPHAIAIDSNLYRDATKRIWK